MIQARKTDGTVVALPADAPFVELINEHDGTVMMVFFQAQPGTILKIVPGSSDAARYEAMFAKKQVRFATQMLERRSNE